MKKFTLIKFLLISILFSSCSKEETVLTTNKLIGVWECDSTVIGSLHSMWFKAKKYDFMETGDFHREYGIFGMQDFGTWDYENNSHTIYLTIDTIYYYSDIIEKIEIDFINNENLILIEDYDSIYLENGEIEYIKEYYTKKQ